MVPRASFPTSRIVVDEGFRLPHGRCILDLHPCDVARDNMALAWIFRGISVHKYVLGEEIFSCATV